MSRTDTLRVMRQHVNCRKNSLGLSRKFGKILYISDLVKQVQSVVCNEKEHIEGISLLFISMVT